MPAAFEGEPLEIGFNPEFLKEGIESVEGDEVMLRLISPLRPGPAAAGRQRRLPLPGDADPPQRLSARPVLVAAVEARPLRSLDAGAGRARRRGSSASSAPTAPARRTSSRPSTSPSPAAPSAPRDRRDLIPFGGSLARAEATVRDEDGIERHAAGLGQPRRGPPPSARRQPRRPRRRWPATARRSRSSRRTGWPWSRARRRSAAPTSTASSPPAGPRASELRQRYGQALAQRNALLAGSPPVRRRRASSTPGTRPWPRPRRALIAARAEAVAELAPPFADAADGARARRGGAALEYAPRAEGDGRGAARRPGRAPRGRPAAGPELLGPAPRRARSSSLDGRSLRRYGSQGQQRAGAAGPALRRARGAAGRAPGRPAAAARRRDERARPRAAASVLAARLAGGGQALITAADRGVACRPPARGERVSGCRAARRRPQRRGGLMRPPRPPPGRRRRSAPRRERAAPQTALAAVQAAWARGGRRAGRGASRSRSPSAAGTVTVALRGRGLGAGAGADAGASCWSGCESGCGEASTGRREPWLASQPVHSARLGGLYRELRAASTLLAYLQGFCATSGAAFRRPELVSLCQLDRSPRPCPRPWRMLQAVGVFSETGRD